MAVDADRAVLDQMVKECIEKGQGVTKVVVRGGKRWLQEIMQMVEQPATVAITKTSDPILKDLIRRVKKERASEVQSRNRRLQAVLTQNQASTLSRKLVIIHLYR